MVSSVVVLVHLRYLVENLPVHPLETDSEGFYAGIIVVSPVLCIYVFLLLTKIEVLHIATHMYAFKSVQN